jgi:hypothetical protein
LLIGGELYCGNKVVNLKRGLDENKMLKTAGEIMGRKEGEMFDNILKPGQLNLTKNYKKEL